MIKRLNATVHSDPHCWGGDGEARIDNLFSAEELYPHPVWMGTVTLGKGDSVGYHQHNGDMEIYTVVKGNALFNDNGTDVILYPGDTCLTVDGESHSIKPYDCDELIFTATILAK